MVLRLTGLLVGRTHSFCSAVVGARGSLVVIYKQSVEWRKVILFRTAALLQLHLHFHPISELSPNTEFRQFGLAKAVGIQQGEPFKLCFSLTGARCSQSFRYPPFTTDGRHLATSRQPPTVWGGLFFCEGFDHTNTKSQPIKS